MLAEPRRRMPERAVGIAKSHRRPHDADRSLRRMLARRKEIDGRELRVGRHFGERVDRSARDVGGLELGEPVGAGPIAHAFGDQRIELGDVAAARLGVGEARILGELGTAGDAEEIAPVPVGIGENADMPIGGASGRFRSSASERLLRLRLRKTWPIPRCRAGPA